MNPIYVARVKEEIDKLLKIRFIRRVKRETIVPNIRIRPISWTYANVCKRLQTYAYDTRYSFGFIIYLFLSFLGIPF